METWMILIGLLIAGIVLSIIPSKHEVRVGYWVTYYLFRYIFHDRIGGVVIAIIGLGLLIRGTWRAWIAFLNELISRNGIFGLVGLIVLAVGILLFWWRLRHPSQEPPRPPGSTPAVPAPPTPPVTA